MFVPESTTRPVCIIEPERKGLLPDFAEVWRYRELFWVLALRDLTARYKQTYLGVVWAVLVPLAQVMVFNVMFGLVGVRDKLVVSGVPFLLTAFSGNIAWQIFASGASGAGGSIMAGAGMVKKVYFSRLILPLAALMRSFVDCLIMFMLLALLMVVYQVFFGCDFTPTWRLLFLPGFVALAFIAAFSLGIWMSSLTTRWRDLGFVIPFMFQIGQYASPVIYEASIIPNQVKWQKFLAGHEVAQWFARHGLDWAFPWVEKLDPQMLYGLNPMAGVIEGFRWSLFSQQANYAPPSAMMLVSFLMVLCILVSGLWFFRKSEPKFVDIL